MNSLDLLLVEDNPADADLTSEMLREAGFSGRLHHARDGIDALARLHGSGATPALVPSLIVTDLNMPRMNGVELLAALKSDEALRRIPVIVLTTSSAESDVSRCYDRHANCYVQKPVDLDRFVDVARSLVAFWAGPCKLAATPARNRGGAT